MMASGFALFNTAIGRCGVAWGERGVAGVQLPEAGERETRARMLQRFPAAGETAPPPEVQRVIDRLVALLRGEASDFSTIALTWTRCLLFIAVSTRRHAPFQQ